MSQAIITFDIIEYLPSDFNFDNFSFIISSENRDFEQEISYLNKNQITHKTSLNKKDLKYTIKTTRNSSLIGITDLIIPFHILSKRENTFDKTCTITMTDSVKRFLFGNASSSNALKINIHLTMQYKEKEKNANRAKENLHKSHILNSGKKLKPYNRSHSFGKGGERHKEPGSNINVFSQRNAAGNKKNSNLMKQRSNSKPASNIKSSKATKPKTQIFNNNKLKEVQKALLDEEKKDNTNESFIDEEINKKVEEINPQIINFMKEFNNKYPLNQINSFGDVNAMMDYTKDIVDQLLDYQLKYYDLFNKSFLIKNKFKNLLMKYNDKLRMVKKQIYKLEEENDLYEIKQEANDKNNYKDIKELFPLKENELDTFKELYGIYLDKPLDNIKEENKDEDNVQKLLIKVLTHNINKLGPINKIFNQTNSTEPERINMRKLAAKYNLPINVENEGEENKEKSNNELNENDNGGLNEEKKEEQNKEGKNEENNNDNLKQTNIFDTKITKWEYVSTEKPDKIDKKLEQYLKFFYSKRTFPKVLFKKTSTNNYEYGTQKVMVKIEGDTIRIRFVGGYLLIDKFIELNAATEEKKVKKQNEKINNANKKKDTFKKK